VRVVHAGPVIGLTALLALLAGTVGLGAAGWLTGAGCGLVGSGLLARAAARHAVVTLGPADRVTLTRAVLAGGVAALTADSFTRPLPVPALVALAAVALILDGVDGRVARRTSTSSEFGARFDLEVDAFLILVLSVQVARSLGAWVLLIGLARYAFVAAGVRWAWLREPAPPRYWCKVVAALQGVVLTVVAAGLTPGQLNRVVVVAAGALLAESFGRETWEKWRRRSVEPEPTRVVVTLLGKQVRAG
jgi:phosphatidylglycerophosphate synthase